MIDVVIINKSNITSDIDNMLKNLSTSNNIYKIYYIADRCSNEFNNYLLKRINNNIVAIIIDNCNKRRTSTLRNIGYEETKKDFNNINGVLFIDGDRWFIEGSTEKINENVVNNIPIDSIRIYDDSVLLKMKNEIINAFYSACVYIPIKICELIEEKSIDNKLWNEDIESIWGIEDLFMGNQLNILGVDYIYNRDIRLNNSEMTGYSNTEQNLNNMFILMDSIYKFKQNLSNK